MTKLTTEERKARRRAYFKRYYQEHKDYFTNRKKNNREHENTLNREARARAKQRDLNNYRSQEVQSAHDYRSRQRQLVFDHYSKGTNRCNMCGESRAACLSIDHINGGGTQHKKSLKEVGISSFYGWLIRSNYPKGYQVLCMNCQWVKRVLNNEMKRGERSSQQ